MVLPLGQQRLYIMNAYRGYSVMHADVYHRLVWKSHVRI